MILDGHGMKLLLFQTASRGHWSFVQKPKGNACRGERLLKAEAAVIGTGAVGLLRRLPYPALAEGVDSRLPLGAYGAGQLPAGTAVPPLSQSSAISQELLTDSFAQDDDLSAVASRTTPELGVTSMTHRTQHMVVLKTS